MPCASIMLGHASPRGADMTSPEHLNFIIHGISHVLSHFLMALNVSDFPSDLASTTISLGDGHLKFIADFCNQRDLGDDTWSPCEVQFCLLQPVKPITMHLDIPRISHMKVHQSSLLSRFSWGLLIFMEVMNICMFCS